MGCKAVLDFGAVINSDNPYLSGSYAPVDREVDGDDLEVIAGQIPADLEGVYVRNGPNSKFEPRGEYHWFDGDGMLHAIRFRGGKASYRNRYVRTEHLAQDEAAGHTLWTGLMESTRENPKGAPYKDTANTDVYFHNKELVASWYICGKPYRVDPVSLESRGATDFGAGRPMRISAHGKVDDQTGELMVFDYGPRPPFMSYGVVNADGALVHWTEIDVPGPRLPHDMAITERYSVLMDLPVFFGEKAMRERKWAVEYHDLPARFGVLPRHGDGASIKWFEAERCYIYHVVNAWEEGDEVVMVACRCDDPLPKLDPADGKWARMMANLRLKARLHEWRFNLETGQTRERPLDDLVTEFPSVDARVHGRRNRFAYNVRIAETPTLVFDGLVKYDLDTGRRAVHEFGPGRFGSEAPFAPAVGSTTEDHGYLISFVHDARADRSEAVILDARDIEGEPVARVALPQRVPLGFHACWVPEAAL